MSIEHYLVSRLMRTSVNAKVTLLLMYTGQRVPIVPVVGFGETTPVA